MKITPSIAAGLLACSLLATVRAQDIKFPAPGQPADQAAQPMPAAAPTAAFTDAQLAEEFGWFMAKRTGIADLQFSPAESEALVKGIGSAVSGRESPYDLQQVGPQMDSFIQRKQGAYIAKLKAQSVTESAAFFDKLKENKNVVELPSGLRYEIVLAGSGPMPKLTDTVTVNYTGRLVNGTVFDTSLQPRQPGGTAAPASFALDSVIDGWKEGIQKVAKGGKIKLYVPANLAYGDDGRSGIPPASALIFDIELIDFQPTPAGSGGAGSGAPMGK